MMLLTVTGSLFEAYRYISEVYQFLFLSYKYKLLR